MYTVLTGDCRDILPTMEPESIDAVLTDPPYELDFMGKVWDRTGVAFQVDTWRVILDMMKPGAYMLCFGGTRTEHRMTVAIEDAGFEIRDKLLWLYGSGFPKSLDISKAMDKDVGIHRGKAGVPISNNGSMSGPNYERTPKGDPVTKLAQRWKGWGTSLKPAYEPIILARKPLIGTVTDNVMEYGTGGMNIDGCRIGTNGGCRIEPGTGGFDGLGRWPSNILLDEEAAEILDDQTGTLVSGKPTGTRNAATGYITNRVPGVIPLTGYGDQGGASRFFYCAKASQEERDAGLEGLPVTVETEEYGREAVNHHPTVKPVALMRYLARLITPPNGIILDPFTGSGSTGIAADQEGFRFIGTELNPEYVTIAIKRIEHSRNSRFAWFNGWDE